MFFSPVFHSVHSGGLSDIDPWTDTPPTETPLDRDPPGQRIPSPRTETPLERDPLRTENVDVRLFEIGKKRHRSEEGPWFEPDPGVKHRNLH